MYWIDDTTTNMFPRIGCDCVDITSTR